MPGQALIGTGFLSDAAAAAKSLQSCQTLCDPIDGSPPGSPNPGILQARTLEYDCLAAIFPSVGSIDVMLQVDALTKFSQQGLQDYQKTISALNAEQMQIRKEALQTRLALYVLTAIQGGTYAIIHIQCCTYVPDMSTNVTHFTKHMNKMVQSMDSPEASVTSLWETLISSPWGGGIS